MIGLRSYVRYFGDNSIRGTVVGETADKWLVEWWSPFWTSSFVNRVDKLSSGLIEIMMCDEPVKNVGDRLILESEYLA